LIVLMAALLWAQLGALAHAYSHLHADSATSGHSGLCNDCLAFAPLLASVDGPVQAAAPLALATAVAADIVIKSLIERQFRFAFRSRAPPLS
jgi:hypothetical protein